MTESAETPPEQTPSAFTKEELKQAHKAFKKRLKLTRLDEESRIGRSPMTSGGKSGVFAIRPPDQFPKEIWQELVRIGRLRDAGGGMFEVVES